MERERVGSRGKREKEVDKVSERPFFLLLLRALKALKELSFFLFRHLSFAALSFLGKRVHGTQALLSLTSAA